MLNIWRTQTAKMVQHNALWKTGLIQLIYSKMRSTLVAWKEQAVESKRVELMMAGAIKQMLHRQLLVALEQWQQVVAEMKQQSMLLNQGAGLLLTRQLSKGWQKWQQASIGSRATLWFASQARAFGSLSASFAVWHSAHVLGYNFLHAKHRVDLFLDRLHSEAVHLMAMSHHRSQTVSYTVAQSVIAFTELCPTGVR